MDFLTTLLLEMSLIVFLGVLYYFYQRRKILNNEYEKGPLIMGYILQSCLTERGDDPNPRLDAIIEALDDYLHNNSSHPPETLLKIYASSPECSPELQAVILEGLKEYGDEKE